MKILDIIQYYKYKQKRMKIIFSVQNEFRKNELNDNNSFTAIKSKISTSNTPKWPTADLDSKN